MLDASTMANKIYSAIYYSDDATKLCQILGQTIAEYLDDNLEILYSWSGVNPSSGASDPTTVAQGKGMTGSFICWPTMAREPQPHCDQLSAQIQDGILTLMTIPPSGWSIPPTTLMVTSPLCLTPSYANSGIEHWVTWCSTIIDTVETWINPTVLSGTHGSYTGSPGAVMTTIF